MALFSSGPSSGSAGTQPTETPTTAHRRAICQYCDIKSGELGKLNLLDKCRKCGCPVMSKTLAPSATCPYGKW